MGRPTKLTAAVQNKIVTALAAGNTRTASVAYAGIQYSTFLSWIESGEAKNSGKFSEFSKAIKKAESDAEVFNVAIIKQAAPKNWQAAAWWLERRRHKDWMKREGREITGEDGAPLQISWADE